MSDFEAVVRWYLVLALMAGVGLPLGTIIFGDSRRYATWFSRPLGMLAVFFPTWFLSASVNLPYTTIGLYLTAVIVGAVAWFWVWRSKLLDLADWPVIVTAEATTLLTFLGALYLRGFTPNILNTEKPMDAAFLASSIRTDIMPPPDPWMAGESINYYYVGYALHGTIARMAGVAVGQAFNLALITTTAIIIASVVGSVAIALPKRVRIAGPIAVFFVVIAGNMVAPYQFLKTGREGWDLDWYSGYGWNSSRVVHDGTIATINEFPSFSIILGDLHPHLTALPFAVMALSLAILIARQKGAVSLAQLIGAGILGGSLYAMNSWDLPTYFGLIIVAMLWNLRKQDRRVIFTRVGASIASALIAWAPFLLDFTPFVKQRNNALPNALQDIPILKTIFGTIGANHWNYTSAGEFLQMFGLPYVVICIVLVISCGGLPDELSRNRHLRQGGIAGAILIVVALLADAPVLVFVGIPFLLASWVIYRKGIESPEGLVSALFVAGSGLLVLTEFFFIQDAFANRMNTLFKVYYQVWLLWGIGAAIGLVLLLTESKKLEFRSLAITVATVSLVLGLVYPINSALRFKDFYNAVGDWGGLNGTAYAENYSPDILDAISYLEDHASSDSVLLEAPGCSYQPVSRLPFDYVSAFTGIPTVMGWAGHESQWRTGNDALLAQLTPRADEARAFYDNPTEDFVDQYDVDFVYYGIYEAGAGEPACESAVALPKPTDAQMSAIGFTQVFQQGDVTIWQRTS